MGTYARKTCHDCGIIRPINYMQQKEISYTAGKTGWGVSFNPQKKKSIRLSSGRSITRYKKVWRCKNWGACNKPDYYKEKEEKIRLEKEEYKKYLAEKEKEREIEKAKLHVGKLQEEKEREIEKAKSSGDKLLEDAKKEYELEKNKIRRELKIKASLDNAKNVFKELNNVRSSIKSGDFIPYIKKCQKTLDAFKFFKKSFNEVNFETEEIISKKLFFDSNTDSEKIYDDLKVVIDFYMKDRKNDPEIINIQPFQKSKKNETILSDLIRLDNYLKFKKRRRNITIVMSILSAFISFIPAILFFLFYKRKIIKRFNTFTTPFLAFESKLVVFLDKTILEIFNKKLKNVRKISILPDVLEEIRKYRTVKKLDKEIFATYDNTEEIEKKLSYILKKDGLEDPELLKNNDKLVEQITKQITKKKDIEIEEAKLHVAKLLGVKEREEDKSEKTIISNLYENEKFYDICMFILSNIIAKVDGLSNEEKTLIDNKFNIIFEKVDLDFAKSFENQFKEKTEQIIIKLLTASYKKRKEKLELLFNNLILIAEIDGKITTEEREKLKFYAKSFGIPKSNVESLLKSKNPKPELNKKNDEMLPIFDEIYDEVSEGL